MEEAVVQQDASVGIGVPEQGELRKVYFGTPEKVAKKRLIEVCVQEHKPIYKAVLVDLLDAGNVDKNAGEVLITHKLIASELDKDLTLLKVGCSETVVVIEALLLFEEEFNVEFVSLGSLVEYRQAMSVLTSSVEGEDKTSFARFCLGLWLTLSKCGEKTTQAMKDAVKAGLELFNNVGEEVVEKIKGNEALQEVAQFSVDNLCAWATLYMERHHRHKLSHPFKFIGNDVETACAAFTVLEYAAKKMDHQSLAPLLKAAIPYVHNIITKQEKMVRERKQKTVVDKLKVEAALAYFGI